MNKIHFFYFLITENIKKQENSSYNNLMNTDGENRDNSYDYSSSEVYSCSSQRELNEDLDDEYYTASSDEGIYVQYIKLNVVIKQ